LKCQPKATKPICRAYNSIAIDNITTYHGGPNLVERCGVKRGSGCSAPMGLGGAPWPWGVARRSQFPHNRAPGQASNQVITHLEQGTMVVNDTQFPIALASLTLWPPLAFSKPTGVCTLFAPLHPQGGAPWPWGWRGGKTPPEPTAAVVL